MKVTADEIRQIQDDEFLQVSPLFAILRETVVVPFLGVPTIMYANDKFNVIDAFGMIVWTDNAEGVSEFVEGLLS